MVWPTGAYSSTAFGQLTRMISNFASGWALSARALFGADSFVEGLTFTQLTANFVIQFDNLTTGGIRM